MCSLYTTTNRNIIIKFVGCYHGHVDSLLVKAGSGLATLGVADSPGFPEELSKLTITIPYNDNNAVKEAFNKHAKDIAAVIVEPIAGNMGFIEPNEDFLQNLRLAPQCRCITLLASWSMLYESF